MNSKLKVTLIVGIIIFISGAAVSAAGFMMGGAKDLLIWPKGPTVIGPGSEEQMEMVDMAFENISGIALDIESIDRVTIKEGPSLSVKGQNLLYLGGLKAERTEDGTFTVTNSVKTTLPNFVLHLPDFLKAKDFWRSYVEITVPRGTSLAAVTLDVEHGDVEVENIAAGSAEVDSESGDVLASGLTCDEFKVSSSYGEIDATNVNARYVSFANDSGDIGMTNLTASGRLDIKSSYGEVRANAVSTGASECELSSGNFTADNFYAADGMKIDSSYGDVKISGDLRGGSTIKTSSGKIVLALDGAEGDYFVTMEADAGDIAVEDEKFGETRYFEKGARSAPNHIELRSNYGDVRVDYGRSRQ